ALRTRRSGMKSAGRPGPPALSRTSMTIPVPVEEGPQRAVGEGIHARHSDHPCLKVGLYQKEKRRTRRLADQKRRINYRHVKNGVEDKIEQLGPRIDSIVLRCVQRRTDFPRSEAAA